MTHARKRIQIHGVSGVAIRFVGHERADDGRRNVAPVPACGVETCEGDLITGGFGFTGRLDLPVLVQVGSIRGAVRGGDEAWYHKTNEGGKKEGKEKAPRSLHEFLLGA